MIKLGSLAGETNLQEKDPLSGVALDMRIVGVIDEGVHTIAIILQREACLNSARCQKHAVLDLGFGGKAWPIFIFRAFFFRMLSPSCTLTAFGSGDSGNHASRAFRKS